MDQNNSQESKGGCFAWLFRTKKSVNERLARIRNSLRKKLSKNNRLEKPLTSDDLENETGSPDLIISRVIVNPRQTTSTERIPSAVDTHKVRSPLPGECNIDEQTQEELEKNGYIGCTPDGNPDPLQVANFVKNIIRSAEDEINVSQDVGLGSPTMKDDATSFTSSVMSIMANDAVKTSLTNIIQDLTEESNIAVISDTESLSSGAISDLAEAAVTESLTKIINDSDDTSGIEEPRSKIGPE